MRTVEKKMKNLAQNEHRLIEEKEKYKQTIKQKKNSLSVRKVLNYIVRLLCKSFLAYNNKGNRIIQLMSYDEIRQCNVDNDDLIPFIKLKQKGFKLDIMLEKK
jgi:hypothetical protein